MITSREHLIHVLTEAAEVEHNLLCSYLYAAFSLKRAGEPGLTDDQGEAVERWRKAIIGVAIEEMGHLASVNNLLLAVGGAPHFDRPNLPASPGYQSATLVVRLTPFTRETLDHFIFLERAEEAPMSDAAGFEPDAPQRSPRGDLVTPGAADYSTIGELYDSLAEGFTRLAAELGEATLIDPAASGQLSAAIVKLSTVEPITDLATALAVIEHIKEEGEGSSGARDESHFDRFVAIREEWADMVSQSVAFEPAWPAAHDPVMRKPAEGLDRVWVTLEPAATYLDIANGLYGAMLQLLGQAFTSDNDSDREALMMAAIEMMEGCAAVAGLLARTPASAEHPGANAGLTFAVPRNLGHRPQRHRARALFAERLAALQSHAERLTGEVSEKTQRHLSKAVKLLRDEADEDEARLGH